jgi:nitroreductase
MTFTNLIENRKSVREYQKKQLSSSEIKALKESLEEVNVLKKNIEVDFVFIEDGWEKEDILKGRAGYVGNPILAPHYIALLSEQQEGYLFNTAYILEQVVLKAVELNIGSCWVSVEKDANGLKSDLGIDKPGEIVAMIALGYPKTHIPFTKKSGSSRIAVEDFVFKGEWGKSISHEELEMMGIERILHSIRLAPSWANLQPWKLIVDNDKIILSVGGKDVDEKHLMLDAGIMMLYMEKAFNQEGLVAQWSIYTKELDGYFSEYNIPSEYSIIGTLHI